MITKNEQLSGYTEGVEVEANGHSFEVGRWETREDAAQVEASALALLERFGDDVRHVSRDALQEMFTGAARQRRLHRERARQLAEVFGGCWSIVEGDDAIACHRGGGRVTEVLVAAGVSEADLDKRKIPYLSLIDVEAERPLSRLSVNGVGLNAHALPDAAGTDDQIESDPLFNAKRAER